MDVPRIIAMLSGHIDDKTRDVLLTVKVEGETPVNLRIHPGVIGGLTVTLLRLGGKANAPAMQGQDFIGQVMHLTAAVPAIGPEGQKILDLVLEGGMHFPVTFPPHAIPILRNALAALEAWKTTPPPGSRSH